MKKFIVLAYFLSYGIHSNAEDCKKQVISYVKSRPASLEKEVNGCAESEKDFLNFYIQYRSEGNKQKDIGNDDDLLEISNKYFTKCFHSIKSVNGTNDNKVRRIAESINQHTYILISDTGGKKEAFCSAVALGNGFSTPAHCFYDDIGRFKYNSLETDFLFTKIDINSAMNVTFSLTSFKHWKKYKLKNTGKYKRLSRSDFLYFAENNAQSISISPYIGSYKCGKESYIAGVSSLFLHTLRGLNGNSLLKDGILIGGLNSWCTGMEKANNDGVVKHLCSSTGGQSGSPILIKNEDSYLPVGMHLGGIIRERPKKNQQEIENYMFLFESLKGREMQEVKFPYERI